MRQRALPYSLQQALLVHIVVGLSTDLRRPVSSLYQWTHHKRTHTPRSSWQVFPDSSPTTPLLSVSVFRMPSLADCVVALPSVTLMIIIGLKQGTAVG
ncbi:hypothetical protein L210DRAFT_3560372 [Boletus edulis BED1]|uniref:Secreted protein n=1 Tax=Boletus edulis BED1 TaxID=1328754 RepID=A0AAD4G8W1_BOLED|nr:hypothetical protein L210DRAFT_3560372 [Boletus edulis BED1]